MLRNNQKVVFFQQVWKGANPEENKDLFYTTLFVQRSKTGQI